MEDTQKVFTSYDIQACLYDEERVEYFREAIFRTVQPGDVVVDAGSGTGLLGMFAAHAILTNMSWDPRFGGVHLVAALIGSLAGVIVDWLITQARHPQTVSELEPRAA